MSGETDTVETKLSYVTRIVGAVRRLLRLERPDWRESIEDALEEGLRNYLSGFLERTSDLGARIARDFLVSEATA